MATWIRSAGAGVDPPPGEVAIRHGENSRGRAGGDHCRPPVLVGERRGAERDGRPERVDARTSASSATTTRKGQGRFATAALVVIAADLPTADFAASHSMSRSSSSPPSASPPTSHQRTTDLASVVSTAVGLAADLASVTAAGLSALASVTTAVDLTAVELTTDLTTDLTPVTTAVNSTTTSYSCAAPPPFKSVSTMRDAFDKLIALLGEPDHYVKEGEGSIYVVVRIDPYGALQVKVGHTNCMDRRKNEYLRCESTGHAVYWQFHCKVEKRMLVERLIHLSFIDLNAIVVRYPCPGCGTRHREYYSLDLVGGLDAVEDIVQFWVWSTGGEFEKRRV
ncbi:hypothetical protein GGX14DRAFT_576311 [Mycena pura]|uniref:Bacteriophage T5 Orf172 DNA-binding domain-containing protein n=1 Tax=Mycena pura TaxID=153505 RepID=A0AAD6UTN4_9AGAR|nr:hypothetical protein GGX14DRAFT_576311 [Mycena pura]